jgi:hypothetical protein
VSPLALVAVGVVCAALLVLVLDQLRRDRLYVGYAVAVMAVMVVVLTAATVPLLVPSLAQALGALLPGTALVLLIITFSLFVLVYVLTQVSLVANRVAAIVQEMAIRNAARGAAPLEQGTLGEDVPATTGAGERRSSPQPEPKRLESDEP